MTQIFVDPIINKISFNCTYCKSFAHQKWHQLTVNNIGRMVAMTNPMRENLMPVESENGVFKASECIACGFIVVRFNETQAYPPSIKYVSEQMMICLKA